MAAADTFFLTLAWIFCLFLCRATGHLPTGDFWLRSVAFVPSTILVLAASGLYPALGMDVLEETKRVLLCISFVQLGSISCVWATHSTGDQLLAFAFWALSIPLVPFGRSLLRGVLSTKGWWGEPILLIGSGARLQDLFDLLTRNPRLGLHVVGVLSEFGGVPSGLSGVPAFPDLETALPFSNERGIQTAIVALGGDESLSLSEATSRYGHSFPRLVVVPPLSPRFNLCSRAGTLGGYLSIQVSQKLLMPFSRILKRCLDLAIAVPAIVVLLPLMLVIALAIKLTSRGSIFFGHPRIGRDDIPFRAWKFRTMFSDADALLAERLAIDPVLRREWERDHKLRNDPRVTSIGTFLRKYSLDELPQLWNVIKSDMSIVGPRPICSAEVFKYAEYFADYSRVLPGITGLWQISGRNETTYQERVQLDTYYVNNWSPWLDLYIIARTFKVVVNAHGAY